MGLIEHLQWLAERWAETTGRSRATLSSRMASDGKFLDRIERGRTITVEKFEACIGWLASPANWNERDIPPDVAERIAALRNIEPMERAA